MFFKCDMCNETSLGYLFKYDYYLIVSVLFQKLDIDINEEIIYILFNRIFNSKLSI